MKPLILALAALVPSFALANGGGYVAGTVNHGALGAFVPKNAQQIEMQTEDLRIDLHVEYGHVEVEYTLHNPGKDVTAEVGFPCKAVVDLEQKEKDGKPTFTEMERTPPLRNFKVIFGEETLNWKSTRANAKPVDFNTTEMADLAGPYRHVPYWYIFKLPLKAGQTQRLRVSYDTDYLVNSMSVSEDSTDAAETLTYLFSTAAVWKGPITKGKVTIRAIGVDPNGVKLNLAKRFTRKDNTWVWEFTDFEPGLGDDLQIIAHPTQESYGRPVTPPQGDAEPRYADFVKVGNQWSLHHREYRVTASSKLAPSKGPDGDISYEAGNVADHDPDNAWVEGVAGDGVGENLTLTLQPPRALSSIAIRNGYVKAEDESLYEKNGRVAEFQVSVNAGEPFTAALPDERLSRRSHLIPVPPGLGEVKTIKLTIQKVYPGSKYADTAISAIELITPLAKKPVIQPSR